jgi:hypothetical protein
MNRLMENNIRILILGMLFLMIWGFGFVCLLWPYKLQQLIIDFYNKHSILIKFNPMYEWMRTGSYIWSLRYTGLLLIIGPFVLLIYGWLIH